MSLIPPLGVVRYLAVSVDFGFFILWEWTGSQEKSGNHRDCRLNARFGFLTSRSRCREA
jgi:hypothetical protein